MYDKVTQKDIERMEEEIEHRKLVVRKEALEAVKEARAQGDLSENFEYKAAKQFKNENEKRIRYLERMIKTAVVISDQSKSDEVGMNNKVTLYFEDDEEEEEYTHRHYSAGEFPSPLDFQRIAAGESGAGTSGGRPCFCKSRGKRRVLCRDPRD